MVYRLVMQQAFGSTVFFQPNVVECHQVTNFPPYCMLTPFKAEVAKSSVQAIVGRGIMYDRALCGFLG